MFKNFGMMNFEQTYRRQNTIFINIPVSDIEVKIVATICDCREIDF